MGKKKSTKSADQELEFVTCPKCGNEQADMGHRVRCEECGFGPMPTNDEREGE